MSLARQVATGVADYAGAMMFTGWPTLGGGLDGCGGWPRGLGLDTRPQLRTADRRLTGVKMTLPDKCRISAVDPKETSSHIGVVVTGRMTAIHLLVAIERRSEPLSEGYSRKSC